MLLLLLSACLISPETIDARLDADGDGFDAAALGGTDCNDDDATIHPGADELCEDIDRDCDDSLGTADGDEDGFAGCEECDDTNADIHPDAQEVCDDDEVDEDCDGLVNDDDPSVDLSTGTPFYVDGDGDGEGSVFDATVQSCGLREGLAVDNGDCNDSDPFVPMPFEWCENGLDENCTGGDPDRECGQSVKINGQSLAVLGSDWSELGRGLVFLPDIDGDGLDDFAVGAPGDTDTTGIVYLFSGQTVGPLAPEDAFATLRGTRANDYAGLELATGDPDLDGELELLVSVGGADLVTGSGAWFVSELDLAKGEQRLLNYGLPRVQGHRVGQVPWIGGINGIVTTSDTVVVGFKAVNAPVGAVGGFTHAIVGEDSLATADWAFEPSSSIAPKAGGLQYADLDGDGVDDLVGAPDRDSFAGVIFGPMSGIAAAEFDYDFDIFGQLGMGQPSAVGDFDGDGSNELVLTSFDQDSQSENERNHLWIVEGVGTAPALHAHITGVLDPSSGVNRQALQLADVDGDGGEDVIWGMSAGQVVWQIYSGLPEGSHDAASLRTQPSHGMAEIVSGNTSSGSFGAALAVGGDFNGDGRPDVLVGDHKWQTVNPNEGRAWLLLGGRW